jgi:Glycosyltransferase family 87
VPARDQHNGLPLSAIPSILPKLLCSRRLAGRTATLITVSKAGFASLLAAALAIRLLFILTTFGSTDALLFMIWTHLAEREGISHAYHLVRMLNHPPLSMAIAIGADRVGTRLGLEFPDIFRLLQVAADVGSAALVYALAGRVNPEKAREYTLFFFASPAAIFLSGFHCNSDPTMIALLLAAVWYASRSSAGSGALLGASAGIKIVPLPLAPFFLIAMTWRQRVLFAAAAAAVLGAIFLPAVHYGGFTILQNIFGYSGSGAQWGFCGVGYLVAYLSQAASKTGWAWMFLYSHYGRNVALLAIIALWIYYWRRPKPLVVMIGVALLAMNFFGPGFGVQYLVWPLPFLMFALPRRLAYALNAALSIFTFSVYTIWAREFPWWFADAAAPNPYRPLVAMLALPLWVLYGVAIVVALRRQPAGELAPQQLAEGGAGD